NAGTTWDAPNILEQWGDELDREASCTGGAIQYIDNDGYITGAEAVLSEIDTRRLGAEILAPNSPRPSQAEEPMTQAPQPEAREKDFYTTQELADMWELKPVTIYRLVDRGELVAYTIGK